MTIPADWPSGVYLSRLTTLPAKNERPYWQSYVVFIVRDECPAGILFQCSDNTWQAYNGWPYKSSMYTHPKENVTDDQAAGTDPAIPETSAIGRSGPSDGSAGTPGYCGPLTNQDA